MNHDWLNAEPSRRTAARTMNSIATTEQNTSATPLTDTSAIGTSGTSQRSVGGTDPVRAPTVQHQSQCTSS